MARPLRVNMADGWYHVMHRGIERRRIFDDRRDYDRFLELLGEVHERYRFVIHAYCLMENHYHLIVQTPDANLSRGMQWLGLAYGAWYNTRHNRVGPLFHGRFRSVPVEDGAWVYELSVYLHLNPVRTGEFDLGRQRRKAEAQGLTTPPGAPEVSARLRRLREYPWSSFRAYGGYAAGPAWLTSEAILCRAASEPRARVGKYRERVRAELHRGVDPTRLEQFREVVAIGSAEFVERIKSLAGEGGRETERRGRLRARVSFEDVVKALESVRGVKREHWLQRHGDWGKWMALKLARRYCGLTLAELGACLGGIDYAAVSMSLRRHDSRLQADRALRKLYQAAAALLHVEM